MIFFSLFQEGPAETTVYMIAGYAIVFVVMAIYILSIWLRWRNLRRDQKLLESMLPPEPSQPEEGTERND
ncbi:MAG: hypothetical protein DDG59_00885 [Anaerolineae bacterium]|jgi:Na+-transporting methylmalonyl-CoA/oxaloacetate decarboxylase gamma subunit|nr:MAG: hypothetical protein DDG59_00885 [Anaerolineae bacterium]